MGRLTRFGKSRPFRPRQPVRAKRVHMARAAKIIAGLCLAVTGCAPAAPPAELAGLWSAGPPACQAGVGVRFEADSIRMVYRDNAEVLFARPHYEVLPGRELRVRVTYRLPRAAGGVRDPGARGVLVLARRAGGAIAAEKHNLLDGRTGAARLRLEQDPATALLTLVPCQRSASAAGLRGRAG